MFTELGPKAVRGERIDKEDYDGQRKEARRQDGHAGDDGSVHANLSLCAIVSNCAIITVTLILRSKPQHCVHA
jgi:hypothetical protein